MQEHRITLQHGRHGRVIDPNGNTVLTFERGRENSRVLLFFVQDGFRVTIDPAEESAVNCAARPAAAPAP